MTTGAHTVIIINNPTIRHFGTAQSSTTSTWTPPENKEGQTVQSTPRTTLRDNTQSMTSSTEAACENAHHV
eukprot:3020553-Amphidinium_carterae.1